MLMKLLSIETSCDETAITILEANGTEDSASFHVLGDALYSQAEKHAVFGGVHPSLAKREHALNLLPLLTRALTAAGMVQDTGRPCSQEEHEFLAALLVREEQLTPALLAFFSSTGRPTIDAIAVTQGPGLEPALWVGINFARALAYVWDLPIIPVNHLEGHLVASAVVAQGERQQMFHITDVAFPALGLIISGGHTEFVHAQTWGTYATIGGTRDDSIGEAFDKVARLLGVPYPGGAGLSALAEKGRHALLRRVVDPTNRIRKLPRPMVDSPDLDLSFSGLKTAVLYQVRDLGPLTDQERARMAAEFEEAVVDVLLKKTADALQQYPVSTFILGGGVSANTYIRARLADLFTREAPGVVLRLPAQGLSTDNAIMIGMAGYLAHLRGAPTKKAGEDLRAMGTMSL
jgi:N6-L-threonylcarbamoyladenine synthase